VAQDETANSAAAKTDTSARGQNTKIYNASGVGEEGENVMMKLLVVAAMVAWSILFYLTSNHLFRLLESALAASKNLGL